MQLRFWIAPALVFSDAIAQHANAINAAKQANVRHLHYISFQAGPK
jgi:hypothetical protein